MTITAEQADAIYAVLMEECGAPRGRERERFRRYLTTANDPEWRFCGSLGFGGKFRVSSGKPRVDYYPEDRTPARNAMVERANERIKELFT